MYIIKHNNIINTYDELPIGIPNVKRRHTIFRRKGYLIAKIYMTANREPTNLGNKIMENIQKMTPPAKTPSPEISPNTPSPQPQGRKRPPSASRKSAPSAKRRK